MSITVHIPTPLRRVTSGKESVEVVGDTVGDILDALESTYPGFKARICDDSGSVRRFVNIFANDEDIRFLENLDTTVAEGDELSIIPAIAGGTQ